MILTQRLLGANGCRFIDSVAGATTGNTFYAMVVNADCVLSTLTTVGGQNLITQYNLSGKTIRQGTLIPAFNGDPIAAVTVSSGSIIGYGFNLLG
jgi:hypothetical protein